MTEKMDKRMLTGLQPSGDLHIGNYFGSIKPFLDTVAEDEFTPGSAFLMVADYHALTSQKDPQVLQKNIYNIVRAYLACGADPARVVLFRQSDNQDHMELAWVLNCMVSVPFLMQAHSYKDKVQKGLDANAGLFTYPMLMAADITLYDATLVPVGEDQRQHLEYTREAVNKLNTVFGADILVSPQEKIIKNVGVVPGIDGQKMSKSYKNTIPLFATEAETEKAVMKIVTDSDGDFPEHVYNIHRLFKSATELDAVYQNCAGRYGELKQLLAKDINEYLQPVRRAYADTSDQKINEVLEAGVREAQQISSKTLERVRSAIGINVTK